MQSLYRGLFVPIMTPFTPDNRVAVEELKRHIAWLLDAPVDGIIPNGSTGECSLLDHDERKLVCETAVSFVNHRVPVFGGASADATAEAIELARMTERAGADGVMVMPPYYSKISMAGAFEHFKAIAESISIPLMIYNNPARAMIDLSVECIAELAKIKNIRYLKESAGAVNRIHKIARLTGGSMALFSGFDTLALEAYASGSTGWVASSANVVPAECHRVTELALKGDFAAARKEYYKVLPVLEAIEESGHLVQAIKYLLNSMGKNTGKARMPLADMDEKLKQSLTRAFQQLQACK